MQAALIQTKSGLLAKYMVTKAGAKVMDVWQEFSPKGVKFVVFRHEELLCTLYQSALMKKLLNTFAAWAAQRQDMAILSPEGDRAGALHISRDGVPKFDYCQMELAGSVWYLYEVGMGEEGIKLPVYRDHVPVALIEKSPMVRDNLDAYDLFCLKEDDLVGTVLLGVYYDFLKFSHASEFVSKKTETKYMYTTNPELLHKYDPAFKERCL